MKEVKHFPIKIGSADGLVGFAHTEVKVSWSNDKSELLLPRFLSDPKMTAALKKPLKTESSRLSRHLLADLASTIADDELLGSISHSLNVCVAFVVSTSTPIAGIGIDIECKDRSLSTRLAARLRTVSPELAPIETWAVLEAIFKADPEQPASGIFSYELMHAPVQSPTAVRGWGKGASNQIKFQFEVFEFEGSCIAVAIAQNESLTV